MCSGTSSSIATGTGSVGLGLIAATGLGGSAGIVEGRFGFLDLMYEGRWGGLITGDKVQIDFSSRCECGRHGPTILDTIVRYTQVTGQDDHIGCAGTIDALRRDAMPLSN